MTLPSAEPLVATPTKDTEHCALARKVATPQKTGNDSVDRQRKEQYDDLVDAIDIMHAHPQLRAGAVRYLRQAQAEEFEKLRTGNLEVFPVLGRTLGQFIKQNEVWCVTWLTNVLPAYSSALQAKAKEFDKDAPAQQMFFLLHACSSWLLPPDCKYVKVMDTMLKRRVKTAGDRNLLITGGAAKLINPTGRMCWELGVYSVKLNAAGKIERIVHRPTKDEAVLDEGEGLDNTWGIANNFSDLGARFVKGKHQQLPVHKFFDKRSGPNKVPQWTGKCKPSDLEEAAVVLEATRKGLATFDRTEQEQTKKAMEAPAALKRKEAAAKARAKLEESQAQLKQRRIVNVVGSTS